MYDCMGVLSALLVSALSLRSQLRDKEEDVSRARRATHGANMERQEVRGR